MANHLERLTVIDETSVKTNMSKTTGWSPRGQRLVDHAPFGHLRTRTFIAGLRIDELIAPRVLDGPMNRAAFDIYIETQLAPVLLPGDVVIADNLSSHKSAHAQACLKRQDNWMLFLPPCSQPVYGWPLLGKGYCELRATGRLRPCIRRLSAACCRAP
ncbi:MAG: transposase [Roseobacter sp.]|nr:transposase [Roseobacter sp.]